MILTGTHVMLDLETMGTSPDAAIAAIGACTVSTPSEPFYCRVNLTSAVAAGGAIEPETVLWWLRQSEQARAELCGESASIQAALTAFADWLAGLGSPCVWGNGATFDNVILARTYQRAGMHRPWHYSKDRCYRTAAALHPHIAIARQGVHHHALHDAQTQATHLAAIAAHYSEAAK